MLNRVPTLFEMFDNDFGDTDEVLHFKWRRRPASNRHARFELQRIGDAKEELFSFGHFDRLARTEQKGNMLSSNKLSSLNPAMNPGPDF